VRLVSDTPTITVSDAGGGSNQLEWWLDLRKEKLATKFVDDLRALSGNLKARKDAEKKEDGFGQR